MRPLHGNPSFAEAVLVRHSGEGRNPEPTRKAAAPDSPKNNKTKTIKPKPKSLDSGIRRNDGGGKPAGEEKRVHRMVLSL